jgi:hypothetical protein
MRLLSRGARQAHAWACAVSTMARTFSIGTDGGMSQPGMST